MEITGCKFHMKYAVNFPRRDISDLAGVERLVSASEAEGCSEASRSFQYSTSESL